MFGFFFIRRGDSTIIGGAHVKIVAIAHTYGGGWEFKLCDILKNEEVKKTQQWKIWISC